MPQESVLEAALAEDLEGSFERMVREYQDRLYSFAHRLAGNPEDAEEIAQDTFVRAYRAMKTYPAERIRALFEPEDDPGSRPDSLFEKGRRRADIATLVAALPERYRSALILRYMEGLRLEEVAAVLKQPLGTVKSNVHRAVNALREALSNSRRGGAMARQEVVS